MVARKTLDGLRKGKKDVYALNVQYVRRYCACLTVVGVNAQKTARADQRRCSEFLKRDDQILALRLAQEERLNARKKAAVDIDRARAYGNQDGVPDAEQDMDLDEDVAMDDENYGSKTIIIHVGSQNLRLGLATDALPKTVPMVIARKAARAEAEDGEPRPKRLKLDDDAPTEEMFGNEVR